MNVSTARTESLCYIDPRSAAAGESVQHDYSLEITDESAKNYLQWIADRVTPHLGGSVLEVGAGHGAVTARVQRGRHILAVDSSPPCLAAMQVRFAELENVRVELADAKTAGAGEVFDSVLMVNVLEHIPDDVGVLGALRERLRPGGKLIIYVPALDALYSQYDQKVGHQRRYTKARLAAVVRAAGFEITEQRFMNLVSLPAWFVFARLLKRDPAQGGGLSWWDRLAVPLTRWVEERVRVPIGLNLFLVAQRPGS